MIDIWWQGIPNWIVAVAAALTLVAAIVAGAFAGRAAHWTKAQASETHDQVVIARESLKVAQEEANHQREETDRAYRRFTESRLDAIAPVIYAVAAPADPVLELKRIFGSGQGAWDPVVESVVLDDGERFVFRVNLTITLLNVSEQVARIEIVDSAGGDMDVRQGAMIAVPPHESRAVSWTRTVASLATEIEVNDPRNWLFNMKIWVRDLGMNVRDEYVFNGDLRFFRRDGSRLIASVELDHPWTEDVATPLPDRKYERLEL